jgi:uncharacterized protein YgiM (DUF1202 family)
MSRLRLWACLALLLIPLGAHSEDSLSLEVREPFVELHTSPGSGYPIVEIAERGEQLLVLKRRTQWFKVRTQSRHIGWVHIDQLRSSLQAAGLSAVSRSDRGPPPLDSFSL